MFLQETFADLTVKLNCCRDRKACDTKIKILVATFGRTVTLFTLEIQPNKLKVTEVMAVI